MKIYLLHQSQETPFRGKTEESILAAYTSLEEAYKAKDFFEDEHKKNGMLDPGKFLSIQSSDLSEKFESFPSKLKVGERVEIVLGSCTRPAGLIGELYQGEDQEYDFFLVEEDGGVGLENVLIRTPIYPKGQHKMGDRVPFVVSRLEWESRDGNAVQVAHLCQPLEEEA